MSMPEWKKRLILVAGLLEILIFSGTILGWTSLKLMLKNEGIYEYKCKVRNVTTSAITANNSSLSPSALPLTVEATAVNETVIASPALANISLQLNLTIIAPQDDSRQKSGRQREWKSSSVELAPLTDQDQIIGGGNVSRGLKQRTIVIPFQATTTSLNQSFIYHLLRDESVVLTTSNNSKGSNGGRMPSSDFSLSLFSDRLQKHKDRHHNVSTLEQFIHLYMAENLEPVTVRTFP